MKKVLIATEKPFSKDAVKAIVEIIKDNGFEPVLLEKYTEASQLHDAVKDANALIVRSDKIDKAVIDAAPNLEIIVRAGAGFDSINTKYAAEKGIVVENTPGQNANAVAELVMGLLIANARKFFSGASGTELKGKKFGILGFGAVGSRIAALGHGFGMELYTFTGDGVFATIRPEQSYVSDTKSYDELFETCQYLSLNLPLDDLTRGMVGYERLMKTPKNTVIINSARVEIVDEAGLEKAMDERPDIVYLSDVAPKNYAALKEKFGDRIFATPKKCGAQTAEANSNAGTAAANQIASFFKTGKPTFRVN